MALFDAAQRRAGLLDCKQPLQPPRHSYSDDMHNITVAPSPSPMHMHITEIDSGWVQNRNLRIRYIELSSFALSYVLLWRARTLIAQLEV